MKFLLKKENGSAVLTIYTDIGGMFGFTAADLDAKLSELDPTTALIVRLNTDGGQVVEGLAIYNRFNQWGGSVTTINDGVVASMGAIIYLAGGRNGGQRITAPSSMFMFHNPLTGVRGNADELRKMADTMQGLQDTVNKIYTEKTNLSTADIQNLSEDRIFFPEEALAVGIVTEISQGVEAVAKSNLDKLMAKLSTKPPKRPSKGEDKMNFEEWVKKTYGLDAATLQGESLDKFKGLYAKRQTPPPIPNSTPAFDPEAHKTSMATAAAEEGERQEGIQAAALKFQDSEFDTESIKLESGSGTTATTAKGLANFAIKNRWSVDKFELMLHRASMRSVGHIGIHSHDTNSEARQNTDAVTCALLRNMSAGQVYKSGESQSSMAERIYLGGKYQTQDGLKIKDGEQILEASHHPAVRDMSLLQVAHLAYMQANGHNYQGRLKSDGFIKAAREAMMKLKFAPYAASGNTTWSGLNIFDDAMHKVMWAAYETVATTWQEWVKPESVQDFRTHNAYRFTMKGTFKKLTPQGELKHGGFTDDKYTHSAETYGEIIGLDRHDLINDDMGAFNGIGTGLGEEAPGFLEELFYVILLTDIALGATSTMFPTGGGNNNYISGAGSDLGVDGLTLAEDKLFEHVNANNRPILTANNAILLHGTQDRVLARELFNQTDLRVVQTANTKGRPDQNPHVGKFSPVMSGYLNNTNIKQSITEDDQAVPGQTSDQWGLIRRAGASGALMIGSFLNGNKRPTVEQADQAFNVLGLMWRAYLDAGGDLADPKWGVWSKGAA